MQSAGAAIAWRIDAIGTGFLLQLCLCWGMTILAFPTAFIVAISIKETNYICSVKSDATDVTDDDIEKKSEKHDDNIEQKTEQQDNDVEPNPKGVEAKGIRTWIHGLVTRIKK